MSTLSTVLFAAGLGIVVSYAMAALMQALFAGIRRFSGDSGKDQRNS